MSTRKNSKFTNSQIETTVKVLIESAVVRNRVIGEARFLGVDLDTPEGKEFFEREARNYALILIR